jgi:hypothetical protein
VCTYFTERHLQPELALKLYDGAVARPLDHLTYKRGIFRVKPRRDQLFCQRHRLIKLKNAVEFSRPRDFACRHAPRKAAG